MAIKPAITLIVEVAVELMHSGPLDLSKFVGETLMGTKEVHHLSVERPESWTVNIPTRCELADALDEEQKPRTDVSESKGFQILGMSL